MSFRLPSRPFLLLPALLLAALLAGCGALGSMAGSVGSLVGLGAPRPTTPDWDTLLVAAADDANQNSPVAVDVVFARDPALVAALNTTPAARWFATREDTRRSFPGGLGVVSLELVPGQSVRLGEKEMGDQKALAVFAFARYPTPGEHRALLKLEGRGYLLQLGPRDFKALPVSPAR